MKVALFFGLKIDPTLVKTFSNITELYMDQILVPTLNL